jgi:hypothetical protein
MAGKQTRRRETGGQQASTGNVSSGIRLHGDAVKSPQCGALTDGLTRCARPPESGSDRCARHSGSGP